MSLASHRCCGCQKILKQAWIFLATHTITLSGLCIYRKAINKDKPLSYGVLPSRQQSSVSRLPGTPPPSVYQVTHGTALQAAEHYVRQLSCGWYPTTGMTATCKAKRFFPVYRLGEDGDLLQGR